LNFWTRIEQTFKRNGLHLLESLLGRKTIQPTAVDLQSLKKILVIRQHDQLGDFLLSVPVLRALREQLPDVFIAVMVRGYTEPIIRHNRYINDILVLYEKGSQWNCRRIGFFWHQLRRGYDLTVIINTVSHSLSSDLLAWFSHARYILGPSHRQFPGTKRNFFYNLIAPFDDDHRHQSEKNLDIVRYLGVDTADLREHITILPKEQEWAQAILQKLGLDLNRPILGIHPGAGKLKNRWAVTHFIAVALRSAQLSAQVLLFYGPNETDLRDQFLQVCPAATYFGRDLRKLAVVFSCLSVFLGNDTGTTHMAAAVGTPTIVIFGPTPANEWKPWGKKCIALQGRDGDCENVSEEEVYKQIKKMIRLKKQF